MMSKIAVVNNFDSFEKIDEWYDTAHKCSILTPLLCGPGVVHP
jgi:hypothetical protein